MLAFQPVAIGKNSRQRRLKTGLSVNNVNAVGPLCRRRARIAFFRKPRDRRLIFRDKGRMQRVRTSVDNYRGGPGGRPLRTPETDETRRVGLSLRVTPECLTTRRNKQPIVVSASRAYVRAGVR